MSGNFVYYHFGCTFDLNWGRGIPTYFLLDLKNITTIINELE